MGPCAGGAVYSPAMTDFVFMVEGSVVHVHHRPRRREDGHRRGGHVRGARRRRRRTREVGRRALHRAGRGGLPRGRALPALVPAAEQPRPAALRRSRPIRRPRGRRSSTRSIPDNPNKPYDMHDVIRRVVDDGEFLEVHERWAENIVCGFARLGGHSVGVVGNQPTRARRRARHRLLGEGARASSAPATRSTSRSSRSSTSRASCRARRRSGAGSSATARSSSTRTRGDRAEARR